MATGTLSVDTVKQLMCEVEMAYFGSRDPSMLHDDPVNGAARQLFERLQEAYNRVVEGGHELFDSAVQSVDALWQEIKAELKDEATTVLAKFQEAFWSLIRKSLALIAANLPNTIDGTWNNRLDSLAISLSCSLSPSVKVAATEWLSIAAQGGMTVNVSYKTQ